MQLTRALLALCVLALAGPSLGVQCNGGQPLECRCWAWDGWEGEDGLEGEDGWEGEDCRWLLGEAVEGVRLEFQRFEVVRRGVAKGGWLRRLRTKVLVWVGAECRAGSPDCPAEVRYGLAFAALGRLEEEGNPLRRGRLEGKRRRVPAKLPAASDEVALTRLHGGRATCGGKERRPPISPSLTALLSLRAKSLQPLFASPLFLSPFITAPPRRHPPCSHSLPLPAFFPRFLSARALFLTHPLHPTRPFSSHLQLSSLLSSPVNLRFPATN